MLGTPKALGADIDGEALFGSKARGPGSRSGMDVAKRQREPWLTRER